MTLEKVINIQEKSRIKKEQRRTTKNSKKTINKPSGKRQIPYDLTYKWNLINKTSEQNITRDMEIEKKLTVTT